ncbi:MAG: hypothetical protein LBH70_01775 [Spirochaetaceae bacterium]|nr:hypothetical protein [Spirochaetaceae bacterium]
MGKRRLFIGLTLILMAGSAALRAESSITASSNLSLSVSSLPEAQLAFTQSFAVPVLRGDHFLFSGNNLTTNLTVNVSPLSMNAGAEAVLTPIALAQIKAGALGGSGWNIPGLGNGLAINTRGMKNGKSFNDLAGSPFEGLVWKVYGGGVLQFDLAAVLPGDWNHLLFQTYQEVNYRANTSAGPKQLWEYENRGGLFRNGLNYYASYVIGYQLPASRFLNLIGFMGEMEYKIWDELDYDAAARADSGYDMPEWKLSALYNTGITKQFGITVILQMRTVPQYTDDSRDRYYLDRKLDSEMPVTFAFYRAAAVLSWNLR